MWPVPRWVSGWVVAWRDPLRKLSGAVGGAPWEAPFGLGLACPLPLPLPFDPWDGAERRLRIQAISSRSSCSSWSTIHRGGVFRCLFTCVHSPMSGHNPEDRQTPGEVCPRRLSQCGCDGVSARQAPSRWGKPNAWRRLAPASPAK